MGLRLGGSSPTHRRAPHPLRSEICVPASSIREPDTEVCRPASLVKLSYRDALLKSGVQPSGMQPASSLPRCDGAPCLCFGDSDKGCARRATALSSKDSKLNQDIRLHYLSKMQGLCFNCLSQNHKVADYRRQTRCWCCLRLGHLSTACHHHSIAPSCLRLRPSPPSPPASPQQIQPSQPPPAIPAAALMAHFDLSGRPGIDMCNLPFTNEIRDRIDFFESRALIMWIGRNRPHTEVEHVVEAFTVRFGFDPSCVQVSRHNPTYFLVTILDRDAFEEITGQDSFPHGSHQFWLRRWSRTTMLAE
jgi:hypothetical protein